MRRPPLAILRVLSVLALAVGTAAGDPPAPTPPAPPPPPPGPAVPLEDTLTLGARYFDQAIVWVAKGGTLGHATDFYAETLAILDMPNQDHFEGTRLVWFQTPDRMRDQRTAGGATTTKILAADKAWVVMPNGSVSRLHATPGGEEALKQLKEDLVRLQDLTAFITLDGLKGQGVVFEFQKRTVGQELYAGSWLKVARRAPDGRKITFWLAYETDDRGEVRATWPGVVRIDGDAAAGLWTEDWILKDWQSAEAKPRPYRYPMKILGLRFPADGSKKAQKFTVLNVDDIQINVGVDEAKFAPPPAPPGK